MKGQASFEQILIVVAVIGFAGIIIVLLLGQVNTSTQTFDLDKDLTECNFNDLILEGYYTAYDGTSATMPINAKYKTRLLTTPTNVGADSPFYNGLLVCEIGLDEYSVYLNKSTGEVYFEDIGGWYNRFCLEGECVTIQVFSIAPPPIGGGGGFK